MSRPQATWTPAWASTSEEGAEVLARRPRQRHVATGDAAAMTNVPASMRSGMTRCSAPRSRRCPTTWTVSGVGPLDVGAHLLQELDEVVDLRLLGRRTDGRVALGERGGQHRVLGAHDRHRRERDLGAAKPARPVAK